jgi:TonB family protein
MKICPKCQQQFPNGFQYCPSDTEQLVSNEEYVRRTRPITPAPPFEAREQSPPAALVTPRSSAPQTPPAEIVSIPAAAPEIIAPPTPAKIIDQISRETSGVIPPRATEPIRPGQMRAEPMRSTRSVPRPEIPQTPVMPPPRASNVGSGAQQAPQQASQSSAQPWWESQQSLQSSPNRAVVQANPNFGFGIPEPPSLIARLIAGLKSIGDSFKGGPPARVGGTGEFQFLLKEESLVSRITNEISGAANEFRRDPKLFVSEFVRGEGTNRFRRNALLAGSELALAGLFTLYFFSMALGGLSKANSLPANLFYVGFGLFLLTCFVTRVFLLYRLVYRSTGKLAAPKVALEFINWTPLVAILLLSILLHNYNFYCRIFPGRCVAPDERLEQLALLAPTVMDPTKMEVKMDKSKAAKEKIIGGSKPQPQKASGGGGGGKQQPTPPSKGVPPQMALTPQIKLPDPEPPKIKNPTLPVAMTTLGDPSLHMPKGPIGDPTGVPAPPSSGPGTGGGIGRNRGTGVGGGDGGGAGNGRGMNTGGGDPGLGGGRSVEPMTASLRPTILYREKAKYTEEARQNKVQGTVVLQVVFQATGAIADVKVIRGLPDGLTEKAIEAAKKIRFNPAVKNGTPVSVRGTLEFTFNLY